MVTSGSASKVMMLASSKQISIKTLRNVIVDLKERLTKDEIISYAWLPTHKMLGDILKKEKKLPPELKDVFVRNDLDFGDMTINLEIRDP